MKFMRVGSFGAEEAVVEIDGRVYAVGAALDGAFLAGGGVERVRAAVAAGELAEVSIDGERLGAPLERPGKIVCIGLNYRDHADETGAAYPEEPVVFMKDPSTVVGPFDEVMVPRASTKTDWEVELGVVIGRTARYLDAPADAAAHIAGYVLSHDVSEREFQLERGGQWDKGKSCETFNPLGPWFVPATEIDDAGSLGLRLWVNGTLMQDGTTANLIFGIDHVVWYLSQFMVLNPGDVINTGTPAGVALGHADPKPYLKEGDVVELEIDGLGRARQVMVQA
ncbi:fumarylacetoacetate hydrolase family protein [Microbacterium aquimaris]|uniref:Fumarylacetoacetate hydrolase family protein n=1 Tax=Microbacterium aquimaris TaxID=459816 RepID=A0ABU5N2R3_9MICO|nr:fumarylacetoacetate hydrolase family protein [Microbacterium aquimaris]MDZ8160365.1 fumarylacetoacetate hydrolase family protein [Microbacterium aquimaris]